MGAARFDGTLVVTPDGQNGLTVPSVALVFQARALDKRHCLRQQGTLSQLTMDQVVAILGKLIGK